MSNTYKVELLMSELHRQYPLWPSTFSTCECKRRPARGGGKCCCCLEESLAELIGTDLAKQIHHSIYQLHALKGLALEKLNER